MTLEDDFMWITSHAFSEMRLMVEGALNLYEDDSGVLCRLARVCGLSRPTVYKYLKIIIKKRVHREPPHLQYITHHAD